MHRIKTLLHNLFSQKGMGIKGNTTTKERRATMCYPSLSKTGLCLRETYSIVAYDLNGNQVKSMRTYHGSMASMCLPSSWSLLNKPSVCMANELNGNEGKALMG